MNDGRFKKVALEIRSSMPDRKLTPGGYVTVFRDGKWKFEHRVVMGDFLGRELKPGEIVHHLDEDKTNNSIDNLRLLTSHKEHWLLHHAL